MRTSYVLALAALLATLTSPSSMAATGTVTGQLVDLSCYMLDKSNTGLVHTGRGYACAQACAKEGFQVGLVASDGKVYEVIGGLAANKNAGLVRHMGHTVTIAGDIGQRDGFTTISAADLTMAAQPRR